MKKITLITLFILLFISSCDSNNATSTFEPLNGVLWTQTSIEYKVAANQAFNAAKASVEKALKNPDWTAALEQTGNYQGLKPAVIVDVDETVLDNSPFQARLVETCKSFNETLWEKWVNEASAEAVPGAKSFIQFLKSKGIKVFYVTNRSLEEPTIKNIQTALDSDVTAKEVLCKREKPEWGSDKTSRRKFISKKYRILLLVGDDYNDFAFLGKVSPEERIKKAETQKMFWGEKWFIICNPLYGNWEKSLYDYNYILSDEEKIKIKLKYLNTKNGE